MNINIKENSIYDQSGLLRKFDNEIIKIELLQDLVIILLEKNPNQLEDVICFNKNTGETLWSSKYSLKEYINGYCPVSNIYVINNGLFFYRKCGIEEEIDIKTGKVINRELIK